MGIAELLAAKIREPPEARLNCNEPSNTSLSIRSNLEPRIYLSAEPSSELIFYLYLIYKTDLLDFDSLEMFYSYIQPPNKYPNIPKIRVPQFFRNWRLMRINLITSIPEYVLWYHFRYILIEERNFFLDKKSEKL
jgi:hypothetical protein